ATGGRYSSPRPDVVRALLEDVAALVLGKRRPGVRLRMGINAARVDPSRPRPSWIAASISCSRRFTYLSWLVTPRSTQTTSDSGLEASLPWRASRPVFGSHDVGARIALG